MAFGKLGGTASVIVPGMGEHRTPNRSQTFGAGNMKFGQGGPPNAAGSAIMERVAEEDEASQKLSTILEGETYHEASSVLERDEAIENVRSDDEGKRKVPAMEAIKSSVISEEDAAEIMKRITDRNSMLQRS